MTENNLEEHSFLSQPQVVLIVDDEVAIAETLAEFIIELGYTPMVARNGLQALGLVRECWPLLVITDFMMPHLDGVRFISALRAEASALSRTPPPVILLTAANPRSLGDVTADAVLSKPFDLDHLEHLILRLLKSASSE